MTLLRSNCPVGQVLQKNYLSHLKFTCPNKPPQYHRITRSYNLLAASNKEWCFCLLYIYLWNTSTWRQGGCKHKHMDSNFRNQVTLTSQPWTTADIDNACCDWPTHLTCAVGFSLLAYFRTVISGKWHVNWYVKKWRINSRFRYASVYLSCRASTWDDLLVLRAKPEEHKSPSGDFFFNT